MSTEYTPQIKKNILKQLMFSMYSDAKIMYREYVQNAFDSINEAVEQKLLTQTKDGFVDIKINKAENRVTITDNGTGIKAEKAESVLLDVSSNNKDGIHQAGYFGIGRLVGAGFCHKLIFKTSYYGESVATKIELDIDLATKLFNDDEDYQASYVLGEIATKSITEEQPDKHYFSVTLDQIKEGYSDLLEENEIINYLNTVAPVEYGDAFNSIIISSSTENNLEFKQRMGSIKTAQIVVNVTHRIQKQYGLKVVGTNDEIEGLEFFTIKDPNYGELAWGWYALTKYTIQIPSSDNLAGIRLRKHNIQIGNQDILTGRNFWSEDRGNSYFYGELFITHDDLRPNSARDGLMDTPAKRAFIVQLKSQFSELSKMYKKANEAKTCIKSIKEGIEMIHYRNQITPEANDKISNKGIDKFKKLLRIEGPVHDVVELYVNDFQTAKQEAEDLIADINSIQPQIPSTPQTPQSPTSSTPQIPSTPQTPQSPTSPTPQTPSTPQTPTHPTPQTPTDLFKQLEGILDKNEIWFLRRIFRSLNNNCPQNERDLALIEQLKKLVVKDLVNEAKVIK